jgi:CheY-like chemotaxis protein
MDEAVVKRIFEPFFTLKPLGRGTGLGLASVQGAVSQLGGQVRVSSKIGAGSTFEISLPWVATAPAAEPPAAPTARVQGRRLSFLVVDDDDGVRAVTARMLRSEGHHVEEARDGQAALELIRRRPYDLLVSDLVMPSMGGVDLSEEARKLRPEMPILLVSGRPLRDTPDPEGVSYLSKPFGAAELLQEVTRLAERRARLSDRRLPASE